MDLRVGRPLQGVLSVAVLATSGTAGDALDNACLGRGGRFAQVEPKTVQLVSRPGPFVLGPEPRHRLTVELIERELRRSTGGEPERTLESWTIRDELGAALARGDYPVAFAGERFEGTATARPWLVKGNRRTFLLLGIDLEPCNPACVSSLVFGFDRAGKFRKLAHFELSGVGPAPDASGQIGLLEGRYLETGPSLLEYFRLTFRYEWDEAREAFVARNRCGPPEGLRFQRELLEERPAGEDTVSLFARPDPKAPAQRVKVASVARIEFLEGCVDAPPPTDGRSDWLPTPWLRVRIDGREGWIGVEDFPRVSLH